MAIKNITMLTKSKINLPSFAAESLFLAVLLTLVGGFLDAYTFIGRGGVFANAQTGNLVLFGVNIFSGNFKQAIACFIPIIAFVFGVFAAELVKKSSKVYFMPNWERTILVSEMVILFIVGFMPKTISNSIINVTISFVASMQYCSFKKLGDSPYATTMCTGNLRSASLAAYTAFTNKDKQAAIKSIRYFIVIFSFIIGVGTGGLLTFFTGVHAIWFVDILLVFVFILLDLELKEEQLLEEKKQAV
ncbi:YoaK family protein [Clostridium felsineum]|uniref:Uncharacterized protein n=1 Tax=Clostridium felsineum TaxID=36839 RepID=A0A1S8LHJ5_9CLOT|nr:YoaK family protein [Clostridium felsineum]URZ03152.1 hypothetical protein CLAUR_031980 [Clostridium felsineum]URZ08503.1 hypothetical protein CLROS_038850 [Clostridium felsineum]URZ13534.1 hypothetical protein CROST_043000 [Clostridium felsineum]